MWLLNIHFVVALTVMWYQSVDSSKKFLQLPLGNHLRVFAAYGQALASDFSSFTIQFSPETPGCGSAKGLVFSCTFTYGYPTGIISLLPLEDNGTIRPWWWLCVLKERPPLWQLILVREVCGCKGADLSSFCTILSCKICLILSCYCPQRKAMRPASRDSSY